MKKSVAMIGASVLGFAGALGAAVAPASAAPSVVPTAHPCTNALDHVVDQNAAANTNWYMTCIPQYGMGKAEFTVTPPAGASTFPAGYSLTDGHQTVVSSTPNATQVKAYFNDFFTHYGVHGGAPVYTGAFIDLTKASETSTQQTYSFTSDVPMATAFPITSVRKLTTTPAACTPSSDPTAAYDGVYQINYAPVITTFSEVIGNKKYVTTVKLVAPTLTLGLNFDVGGEFGFNEAEPLCATSTAGTLFAASNSDLGPTAQPTRSSVSAADVPTGAEAWDTVANDAATNDPFDLATLVPTTSVAGPGTPTPITTGAFVVTATSLLPETGVDAAPSGLVGGSLLLVGAGTYLFGRRRRRAGSSPA